MSANLALRENVPPAPGSLAGIEQFDRSRADEIARLLEITGEAREQLEDLEDRLRRRLQTSPSTGTRMKGHVK